MKWLILSNKLSQPRSKLKASAPPRRKKKRRTPSSSDQKSGKGRAGRIIFVLLLAAVLIGGIWWYSHNSPRFNIREIKVTNNHAYSPEEIIDWAGLETGGNIFSLNPDLARAGLLKKTDIQDAYIRRIFPDTIRIEVIEREPRARIQFGTLYAIDDFGIVLSPRKNESGLKLPVIRGLKVKRGEITPVDKKDACLNLLRELEEKDIGSLITIDEILIFSSDLIELRANGDIEITLERGDYEVQLGRLKTVLSKLGPDISRVREVDLRYARVPVVFAD
jgi:cell division protein FtsQ